MLTIRPWTAALLLLGVLGCSSGNHLSISRRHTPGDAGRIVVLPVHLPQGRAARDGDARGRTIASLYVTELLRNYEVLEYERFVRGLEHRGLVLDSVLVNGIGDQLVRELQVDGVLLSEVYSWEPGTPGFWFLGKEGRIGFQARLVELRTGSVIWSANSVRQTRPEDPLSVGLASVFERLVTDMPRSLRAY